MTIVNLFCVCWVPVPVPSILNRLVCLVDTCELTFRISSTQILSPHTQIHSHRYARTQGRLTIWEREKVARTIKMLLYGPTLGQT